MCAKPDASLSLPLPPAPVDVEVPDDLSSMKAELAFLRNEV
jgi:hypothetical protein